MPITYTQGCLIKALLSKEVNFIAHGVNCQGVMGSGIALQIKQSFPDVFLEYRDYVMRSKTQCLGDCFLSGQVFNLFTQNHYGLEKRHLNYGALSHSMKTCLSRIQDSQPKSILGIPKIGATRGGGDWSIISEIIEYYSDLFQIQVRVYEL